MTEGICCEGCYKLGIKKGRLDREKEMLEIIDKWWNSQTDGGIDEFSCGYVWIYPEDFEELKKQLTNSEEIKK